MGIGFHTYMPTPIQSFSFRSIQSEFMYSVHMCFNIRQLMEMSRMVIANTRMMMLMITMMRWLVWKNVWRNDGDVDDDIDADGNGDDDDDEDGGM